MKQKKIIISVLLAFVMVVLPLQTNRLAVTAATDVLTLADMPASLKSSIEWVYTNRMLKEGTPSYKNLIFDQIYDGNGTLNFVVRWQSSKSLTLEQRQKITAMIKRQINNWTKYLSGYDGWAYDSVTVNVVGWACADVSQILDKQPNETVYTDYITDEASKTDSSIPSKLPCAPDALSRAIHYSDSNYVYPGTRFDEYLWATSNWIGGCGGDWGQRVSDDYILTTLDSNEVHIIEHEIGHGFGLPDFYEDADRPPAGFPIPTIMWAGNSTTITEWDAWMLRYTWSQIKNDMTRFPSVTPTVSPTVKPTTTPTVKPTTTPTVLPTVKPTTTPTVIPTATPTVKPTITPTLAPSGALQLKTETNSWSDGYTMNVYIQNVTNSSIDGWKLVLNKSEFNITNIWCAEITETNDTYIITPLSWNKTINAGSTVNFGIQALGSPVTNFTYTILQN